LDGSNFLALFKTSDSSYLTRGNLISYPDSLHVERGWTVTKLSVGVGIVLLGRLQVESATDCYT
jgi:hypothetical protein